ncbi:MAG TPA: choice-of-anchor tandem repeat NxxGxxAF-containing protein, partial [Lacipirellulaceae bacterium]|nr:choice-of-anchor tandem repeat NxxGxxAF-containing protein [Lacipirellulaceae bacterium]
GKGQGLQLVEGPGSGSYFHTVLNDSGDVIFGDRQRLWRAGTPPELIAVASQGGIAPGSYIPSQFDTAFYIEGAVLSDNAQIAFAANTGPARGIWYGVANDLQLIAKADSVVPGDPLGRILLRTGTPQINDAGEVLFAAGISTAPTYETPFSRAVYLWDRTRRLDRLAADGDVIHTERGDLHLSEVFASELNNAGHVTLNATATDGTRYLLRRTAAGTEVIAADNDIFGDELIHLTSEQTLGGNGDVAYIAFMRGGNAVPNEALQILKNSTGQPPIAVARTNTQPPGAPTGTVFALFGINSGLVINSHGQVAFGAVLRDAATAEKSFGIWAQDRFGELKKIVMVGDVIDVDTGPGEDLRIVNSALGPGLASNERGAASQFNNRGQLLFSATFTDGSSGVFISNEVAIPEPDGALIAASWVMVQVATKRRRTRRI